MLPLIETGDAARGVAAFRRWLVAGCKRLAGSTNRASELRRMGLPDADPETLCIAPDQEGRAIASRGRNVLVEGSSGGDGASGPRALFLVAPDDARPTVTTLVIGPAFEATARVAMPGSDDAVMLCTKDGRQGLYYGACGFLGEGTFQRTPAESSNELRTRFTTRCGESDAVNLGTPSLLGDMLEVPLVHEKVRASRAPDDEGDLCSRRRVVSETRVTIQYRLRPGRFERVTKLPRAVEAALATE